MAATGRALSRLSRAFARAHVARGAAPVAPGARPLALALSERPSPSQTRFESSNAATRARKLEDEQVRAAGAALDAIKPVGETAHAGLGDGASSSPAGMFTGTDRPGVATANASQMMMHGNGDETTTNFTNHAPSSSSGRASSFAAFPTNFPSSVVYVDTLAMVRALERAGMDARVAEGVAREVASATRNATGPLASRAEFEKLTVSLTAKVESAESEMKSRQREQESSSRHSVAVVTSEI